VRNVKFKIKGTTLNNFQLHVGVPANLCILLGWCNRFGKMLELHQQRDNAVLQHNGERKSRRMGFMRDGYLQWISDLGRDALKDV